MNSQGCLSNCVKYQVEHGSILYCDGGESVKQNVSYNFSEKHL